MPVLSFCLAHFVVIIWNFDQVFHLKCPLSLSFVFSISSPSSSTAFLCSCCSFPLMWLSFAAWLTASLPFWGSKGNYERCESPNRITQLLTHTDTQTHTHTWPGRMWAAKARADFDHVVPLVTWTVSDKADFSTHFCSLQQPEPELSPCDRCVDGLKAELRHIYMILQVKP